MTTSFAGECNDRESNKNEGYQKEGIGDLCKIGSSEQEYAADDCQQEADKNLDERPIKVDHIR